MLQDRGRHHGTFYDLISEVAHCCLSFVWFFFKEQIAKFAHREEELGFTLKEGNSNNFVNIKKNTFVDNFAECTK